MMDSDREVRALSPGHRQALNELRQIEDADPTALEILEVYVVTDSGSLPILVSLGTAGSTSAVGPIATGPNAVIRAREQFQIFVPENYPFAYPHIAVPHDRFSGLPHVQWQQHLCLYISPTTEWQPADGMFGFIDRLLLWVSRAATGTLDPAGEPLHPPVAYTTADAGAIVVRADAPQTSDVPWQGFALLRQMSDTRVDLVGWVHEAELQRLLDEPPGDDVIVGLAILLPQPTAFEFPRHSRTLLDVFHAQGIVRDELLARFTMLAFLNRHLPSLAGREHNLAMPTYVIVGTPMRGIAVGKRRYHLAAWRLSELGRDIVALLDDAFSGVQELAEIAARAGGLLARWLESAEVTWAHVYEDRPEVTTRRDVGSPLEAMRGRRVLLLGCGAIGGHIAEYLARAGTSCLVLMDRSRVAPGVLVRQPYVDADIHRPKAEALADHLRRIRPELTVEVVVGDALATIVQDGSLLSTADLIVDATANPAVMALLERRRREVAFPMPPIVSLVLGHTACRGITMVALSGYSGAGVDLLRKVKLATLKEAALQAFADDFFPDPPRTDHFQPEPGCSEATFVGSDAEVAALTATMLLHALKLCVPSADPTVGSAILVDLGIDGNPATTRRLCWSPDVVLDDIGGNFEVRFSSAAVAEFRAECRLMMRRRGPQVETGGILLGEIDDACSVVWLSHAVGPPPDSHASAEAFVCGVEGVEDMIDQYDSSSRGALRFLGMWHSHPGGKAMPSTVDDEGMRELVFPVARAPRRALIVILGGTPNSWQTWLREATASTSIPQIFIQLCHRTSDTGTPNAQLPSPRYTGIVDALGRDETRRWPLPMHDYEKNGLRWLLRWWEARRET